MLNRPKPLVLLILDGFGYSLEQENNAIAMASTPCRDQLQKDFPLSLLNCSGRYIPKDFSKVNDAIEDGRLSDLAPTMLSILGIKKPVEMTGKSLIKTA